MQEENKGKNELVKINFSSKEELMDYICNVEKDEKQAEAMRMIFDESSNKHIFITGMTGTGKTTFIKRIKKFLENHIFLAYDTSSALNLGAASFRTFFQIKTLKYKSEFNNGRFFNYENINLDKTKIKVIRRLNFIIIDDISRYRADTLDRIAEIIRSIRNSNEPFGGVRLIMVGDLYQIPPFLYLNEDDPIHKYYDTKNFFSSKALMASGFNVVTFDKIYRKNDEKIIEILKEIRIGKLSKKTEDKLNSLSCKEGEHEESIRICSYLDVSDFINNFYFNRFPSEPEFFDSVSDFEYIVDGPFHDELFVKIGSRVVITRNWYGFRAGSTGIIKHINDKYPDFFESYAEVVLDESGECVNVYNEGWAEMGYRIKNGAIYPFRHNSIIQYPIMMGYSVSVFELYDMEFDSARLFMKVPFSGWRLYMAMSRCRSLDRVYIEGKVNRNDIVFDNEIHEFYKEIENKNGIFEPIPIYKLESK